MSTTDGQLDPPRHFRVLMALLLAYGVQFNTMIYLGENDVGTVVIALGLSAVVYAVGHYVTVTRPTRKVRG